MWELRKKSARGRLSLRRFSLVAMAMLMAMFVLTSIISPQALAADATRDADTVKYDGRTFNPMSNAERPSGIQKDITGYASIDEANKKAYYILTTGDPAKATSGQYVIYDFTPPDNYSNSSPPVTVSIVDTGTATATDASAGTSGCNADSLAGIGWILCPVVNFLASGMDHLYDALTGFLVVQPARASEDNSLFKMWGIVRNLANISFVILFLLVIFSQVTSVGISNYGIKKIMPRLVVTAILVNISFWICAIGIDISNTLGYGIHSLFMNVFDSLNTAGNYQNLTWTSIAQSVLSGTAVAGLAAYGIYGALSAGIAGTLIMFIPILVGVLLSVLVALLVISVRQALIVCLVIISPLAFVAFLLPNTEKWFTKWRELFVTLLLVYPIFAVVFGGSQLAGMAIIQNAGGSLNLIILGMAVQVAPVVITPLLIRVSGSLVGKIAGIVNNPTKGVVDKTRTWAQGRAAEEKAKILAGAARDSRANRLTQRIDYRRRRHEGYRKSYEGTADNRFAESTAGQNIEAMTRQNSNEKQRIDNEFLNSERGRQLELQSRNHGVRKQEIENVITGSAGGQTLEARTRRAQIGKTEVDSNFEESRLGHRVDRERREAERRKQTIEAGHEHEWHFRNEDNAGSQEREMQLRTATDRAATSKLTVDTTYSQLKAGQAPAGASAVMNALATEAYEISRGGNLETSRQAQAEHTRQERVNEEMLKNTVVIGATNGRPGQTIVEYAAGIGKSDTVLATAIAKQRRDFDEAQNAQSELMKHFKVNAPEVMDISMGVQPVRKVDDHGNTHVFDMTDDATREAAIEMVGTVGSHNDKKRLVLSSGAKKDAAGNVIPGKEGVNYKSRASIQAMVIKSGFGGMAPGINDKALNDLLNGDITDEADWNYHSAREIAEGRIKVNTLASANQDSLQTLYDTKFSTEPAFVAARQRMQAEGMMDKFNEKYETLQGMTLQVLTTPTIRQNTTSESIQVMLNFVKDSYTEDAAGNPIRMPKKKSP